MAADWDIAMAIKPMKYKYCSLTADISHTVNVKFFILISKITVFFP